jgi:hypothetical protein
MALPADVVIAALRSGACLRISSAGLAPNVIESYASAAKDGGSHIASARPNPRSPAAPVQGLCRLSVRHPEQFGTKQHSIVQRLLKTLRKKAAEKLIAQEPPCPAMTTAPPPGAVDGSGYARPDPPTAPPVEPALEVGTLNGPIHTGSSAPTAPPG